MDRSESSHPSSDRHHNQPSIYNLEFLLNQSRWIRDDLDTQIARDGPDALRSDDILNLDSFLRRLLTSNISLDDIRFSRLHLALRAISGQATRWPKRLISRADEVKAYWENQYASLDDLTTPLYEQGGRLFGLCKPEDLNKDMLMIKWLKTPGVKLNPFVARRQGDLGFKPGDWWISPLFAFRDGIIDSADSTGGIISDVDGAYAVLMTNDEEISGPSPESFIYRARNADRGRYRLASATPESRLPMRILRGHSLRSFWSPKAGIRYDGLHNVVGWSIARDRETKEMVYEIKFKRLATETPMDVVMKRPYSDEVEDYKEYKRVRQIMRDRQDHAQATVKKQVLPQIVTVSADGVDESKDEVLTEFNDGKGFDEIVSVEHAKAHRKDSFA